MSVVIPAYNYVRYLPEAIDSVLTQTHERFEIIVVDDGSTDNTKDLVLSYKDPRVRYVWQKNQGLSAARNTGIREARYDYVAFLDADDLWRPQFLARVLDRFSELDETFSFVATDTDRIGESGESLPGNRHARVTDAWCGELSARNFCLRNRPLSSSIVVRRAALADAGWFDPLLRSSEDRDMWIRLTQHRRAWFIAEPLALIRRHGENMSRNAPRMQHNSFLVLTRAWRSGAVSQWKVWFWLRALAVHYFQSAWTHHDQRFHGRAFAYLLLSIVCWPFFLQPKTIWEPRLFRLRALGHYFRDWFALGH